jgi:hypothetical protein
MQRLLILRAFAAALTGVSALAQFLVWLVPKLPA